MKTMVNVMIALWCLGNACMGGGWTTETDIAWLDEQLATGGVFGLVAKTARMGRAAPCMPSAWSCANRMRAPELEVVCRAGREFGRNLAGALDGVAADLRLMPAGEELRDCSHRLCDLSDWCAGGGGYGNLMLARRCLDLASVGLARLAADMDFPMENVEKLAQRMEPVWMSVKSRATVLNAEACAEIFPANGSQRDLERIWSHGRVLARKHWKNHAQAFARRMLGIRPNEDVILKNSDFFDREEFWGIPATLQEWDFSNFVRLVDGLELKTVYDALALVQYRKIVGSFPETIRLSEAELQNREEMKAFYVRMGYTNHIALGTHTEVTGREAFRRAWEEEWSRRADIRTLNRNLYVRAWQTYCEVRSGCFFDEDTRNRQEYEAKHVFFRVDGNEAESLLGYQGAGY